MKDFDLWDIEFEASQFEPLPTNDQFLDSRYEWQKTVNGAEWPYYRFFYYLSKKLQPNLVVELGGYQGTAAAHFVAPLSRIKRVITIDHHSDPGDEINRQKMIEACREYLDIVYIRGWTNDTLAEREKGKHQTNVGSALLTVKRYGPIDILFIDSWHNYDEAMLDWETYKPLLASPALVICDDIQGGYGPAISGMLDFWNELPGPKFLNANLHPGTNMGFIKYGNT